MAEKERVIPTIQEMRMTDFYNSKSAEVKKAIEETPPGYYNFIGDGEKYRCIGWADPDETGECKVFVEREIEEGTIRVMCYPRFLTHFIEAPTRLPIVNIIPESKVLLGRVVEDVTQYLKDSEGNNRIFEGIDAAILFLREEAGCQDMSHNEITSKFVFLNIG